MADGATPRPAGGTGTTSTVGVQDSDRQIQNKEYSLSRAKDRAQNAATIATSVVYAALLKEILVKGSNTSYYLLTLVLVIMALILQVVVGLLSIVMQNIDNHYRKYRGDMCGDLLRTCCCCIAPPQQAPSNDRQSCTCFGCYCCTCSSLSHYEAGVVADWSEWQDYFRSVEYDKEQMKIDIKYLDQVIGSHGEKGEPAVPAGEDQAVPEVPGLGNHPEHAGHDGSLLDRCRAARLEKKFSVREEELHTATGKFLQTRTDNLLEADITKKLTIWQHIINYLLYTVFVLNAFITAFALV